MEEVRPSPESPRTAGTRIFAVRLTLLSVAALIVTTTIGLRLTEASPASPAATTAAQQTDTTQATGTTLDPAQVERGAALFQYGCAVCHGSDGVGTDKGPNLVGVGAAAADFQLSTGRMPLSAPGARTVRKAPGYDQAGIDAMVAYIASLGPGPAIPDPDLANADLAVGGESYRANCAACHNAAGSGGALSYGQAAPSLFEATPVQVIEAMRTGPGQMPVFGTDELGRADEDDIAKYVTETLQDPGDRGGLPIGSTGPVPEGLLACAVGLVVIGAALRWTVRSRHG